uniref:non-specific serine/threonine protein kinase n=1 Tax=Globodera rostochiensis TaxID=31243 RepID=A0A914I2Y1_GLORO
MAEQLAVELVSLRAGVRVSDRWTIIEKLGPAEHGAVYLCHKDYGMVAAMKTERANTEHQQLVMEANVMRSLDKLSEGDNKHFCRCLELGRDEQKDVQTGTMKPFNFIRVADGLVREAGGRFSPGTAIGMALQLLDAIKALHSVGYLHRDIKPANTTIGRPESNEQRLLYLIDFGMARKYVREDGSHRRPRTNSNFRGAPRYASISAHIGRDYSRKDDIESWFYVLVELYTGMLPWSGTGDMREIGDMKRLRSNNQPANIQRQAVQHLLSGCPADCGWGGILRHIDELTFDDRRNYDMISSTAQHPLQAEHSGASVRLGGGRTLSRRRRRSIRWPVIYFVPLR